MEKKMFDEQLNDINEKMEKIDILYDELREKVIAYVYKHQGAKGYIDTQLDKHNDMIYSFRYDFEQKATIEECVYGVRVSFGELQVALEPIHESYKVHWEEQDFDEAEWYPVCKDDCEVHFRPILDNIAEYIEEYIEG